MFRRFKFTYMLYNFFHKKELANNARLYKEWGIDKKYYSPVTNTDFADVDSKAILAHASKEDISEGDLFKTVDKESQTSILDFEKQGYAIINQYLDTDTVDHINVTIEDLQKSGTLKFKYGNKLMFAIHHSEFLRGLWEDKDLKLLLDQLIKGDSALFQSINFIMGSQQRTHSDSIHMTTFPLGGLLGVWLALEDIGLDQGPLHYYPGSHKFPYYLNEDYDNVGNRFMIGPKDYSAYEEMLAGKLKSNNIKKHTVNVKKGDLFIWHANLLHGGEPHNDKSRTRKSMVMHYFDKNRICYHEISQRPALMSQGV